MAKIELREDPTSEDHVIVRIRTEHGTHDVRLNHHELASFADDVDDVLGREVVPTDEDFADHDDCDRKPCDECVLAQADRADAGADWRAGK